MKTYQFTIVIKNFSENLEDKFLEAGCEDMLISFHNGVVYLDFNREAKSLEEAIDSATKDVSSIVGVGYSKNVLVSFTALNL